MTQALETLLPCPDGIAEYNRADTLWHLATDALVAGDYTEFDRLMREFRNISDKWRKK